MVVVLKCAQTQLEAMNVLATMVMNLRVFQRV